MEICVEPDFLRIIYFIKIIINVIFIIVPIGVIVMGLIDLSKSTISSNEEEQKKKSKLFLKRIISAVLVFAVPWIVNVIMGLLGELTSNVNLADCWNNANSEKINDLAALATNEERLKYEEEQKQLEAKRKELEEAEKERAEQNTAKPNTNTNNDDSTIEGNVIFIGDSRTVGMCNTVQISDNEDCSIADNGKGYDWLTGTEIANKLDEKLKGNPKSYVVINMGVNDLKTNGIAENYIKYYNDLVVTYSNIHLVVVSVTPIDDEKAAKNEYKVTNEEVVNFNETIKNGIDSNKISYCDVYSKIIDNFETVDGIHYESNTYNTIYTEIKNCLKQ